MTGTPRRWRSGRASPASMTLDRWTMSGWTSACSQSISWWTSFFNGPSSPRSMATASRPSCSGRVLLPPPSDPGDQRWPVEQTPQHRRHPPPKRQALIQIDIDAAHRQPVDTDVLFVGPQRRIDRGQDDIGPRLAQGRRQRVAVHATSAVHWACTGNQMNDLHAR